MELRLPLEMSPGREAACRAVFGTWGFFSERCTEKLPLRVDFIHRVEFGEVSGCREPAYCILSAALFRIWNSSTGILSLPVASVRNSAHDKGHEEGGSAYAKAGSSLRSPPSIPKTRVCLLYCFVLSPTPLTLLGAVPHYLSLKKELAYSSS